jgi:hypothetical protein
MTKAKRAAMLIKEYNKAVSELPPNSKNPPPLNLKISDDDILSFESGLFETDRFLCGDRWHQDGQMRKAIRVQFEEKRANEELDILVQEVDRYVNWHCTSITRVETAITNLVVATEVTTSCAIVKALVAEGKRFAEGLKGLESQSWKNLFTKLEGHRRSDLVDKLNGIHTCFNLNLTWRCHFMCTERG